jgi:four helix bundle protein
LKWDVINKEYIKQVIRSSGSVSANYTEAADDLGKADERMKLKISRREAKETIKWLDLTLTYSDHDLQQEKLRLIGEGEQIRKILSAILKKVCG